MDHDRRRFVRSGGLGLLAFTIGGTQTLLAPHEARARDLPLGVLSAAEAAALAALGETLLPGARDAGIVHFVDHQLGVDAADCLLLLRYLDVPPPYVDFYRTGLAGLNATAMASFRKPFGSLEPTDATTLVRVMSERNPDGWTGPPAPLFYFATRSDAVDVVYGTEEGFAKLGIPYMAHIRPDRKW